MNLLHTTIDEIIPINQPLENPITAISSYYHNCSGMRSKSKEMYLAITEEEYDVICLTETWLTNSFKSEEFFPAHYCVYRRDRYQNSTTSLRGGGVIAAVSVDYFSEHILIENCTLELIIVRVKSSNHSLLFCVVYIPHDSPLEKYMEFVHTMETSVLPILAPNESLIIVGDFNVPSVSWTKIGNWNAPLCRSSSPPGFFDSLFGLGLKQCNMTSNENGNMLDLVFVSTELNTTVVPCDDLAKKTSIYHTPLNIIIHSGITSINFNSSSFGSFNFRKGDYMLMNVILQDIDWGFLNGVGDLDDLVDRFHNVLNDAIGQSVPRFTKNQSTREPWFNTRLINLKNRKSKAHKKYKSNLTNENYLTYSCLRSEFQILNRFLYNMYVVEIESNIKNNPKKFWAYVDSKRNCSGFPSSMSFGNDTANTTDGICGLFASFFEGVYVPSSTSTDSFNFVNQNFEFSGFFLDQDSVLNELNRLNLNHSPGSDNIPPIVLRNCANVLCQPLTLLFNRSLKYGIFPKIWKTSIIKPIFKSERRSCVENYRGIAILSIIPKLFEKMVKDHVLFLTKNCISYNQHGFYPGRSTTSNLMCLTKHINGAFSNGLQVDTVYTDFSKAFDKIDHHILINKLKSLNCNNLPIKWISSYLLNRYQYVKISDSVSRKIKVTSGVPQGSHLGPLWFILFIDDVVDCFSHCEVLIYADDIKIFKTIHSLSDVTDFQSDLDRFTNWCSSNMMVLNYRKCKSMTFVRTKCCIPSDYLLSGHAVQRVISFLDLGVLFSPNLSFDQHINKCISKASSMLGFIIRFSKEFQDPYTLKTLYVSFVRSHLEYASVIWSPYYQNSSDRIESIQKKFLIFALRRLPRDNQLPRFVLPSYNSRCLLLSVEPLFVRRKIAAAIFVRDVLCCKVDCPEILFAYSMYIPVRRLRSREFSIFLPYLGTNYARSDPTYSTSCLFNLVCHLFDFNSSRDTFRNDISQYFLNS